MDKKYTSEKTIEIAKYFSWFSFTIILILVTVLTLLLGRSTLDSSIKSQEEYLHLLADNFNRQLFRRFTVPIALAEDQISLREADQYRLLDETVENMISGLDVRDVKIYDENGQTVYSINYEDVMSDGLDEVIAKRFFSREQNYYFEERNSLSYVEAFFTRDIESGSFLLKILYPLSVDVDLISFFGEASILGILELTVDITAHYENAISFQRYIFLIFTTSILILFGFLQYIARKAEIVIYERIEKNKQLEIQLHQQEKLASMGRMVASIAHEIRNPLGIIQSSTQLIASRNKDNLDTASQKIIHAMSDEIKRLAEIVNDFLDYARPRVPRQDDVDITFCITKAITFLENKIKDEEIDLEVKMDSQYIVKGEEDLLYRALYNLISNAIQAISESETKALKISATQTNSKQIEIHICDSGKGFSEEAIVKAFDPFFTTKETGTGLGLPIVKSIIEAHGAQINIKNNNDCGASVEIIFKNQ